MDAAHCQAVHDLILEIIDDNADPDGTVRLKHVVETLPAPARRHRIVPKGRLTNYVRYTKTDMEAAARSNGCESGSTSPRRRTAHEARRRHLPRRGRDREPQHRVTQFKSSWYPGRRIGSRGGADQLSIVSSTDFLPSKLAMTNVCD